MRSFDVTIIDYGVGNLLSVQRGFEHCGGRVTTTSDPECILASRHVVLPGVGAFANAMEALERLNLVGVIRKVAQNKTPLMGICLGMQLLLDESEEFGKAAGLGLIPGRVVPVPALTVSGAPQKTPHIGWSALLPSHEAAQWNGTVLETITPGDAAYFVHSYMASPLDNAHRVADCLYGEHPISAVIRRDNVTGCQFHPEKSGEVGLNVLRRFALL